MGIYDNWVLGDNFNSPPFHFLKEPTRPGKANDSGATCLPAQKKYGIFLKPFLDSPVAEWTRYSTNKERQAWANLLSMII